MNSMVSVSSSAMMNIDGLSAINVIGSAAADSFMWM